MKHRSCKCAVATGFLVLTVLLQCAADNIERRSPDLTLHALLMQRADVERNILSHRYPWVTDRVDEMLAENPILARNDPWLLFYRAVALSGMEMHQESIEECSYLISRYSASYPLAAAWAQVWIGHNHRKAESMPEAMTAYRLVEEYIPLIDDMGPVLEARRNAAEHFLRNTRFDPSIPDQPAIMRFESDDVDGWAWARGAVCAQMAYMGNYEAAREDYDRLIKLVGPSDRRVAIAGIDLAYNQIVGYDSGRRTLISALVHAQQLIEDIEKAFPDEKWLIATGKLRMTTFHMRHNLDLDKAERLAREVMADSVNTGLEAEAQARLVEILFQRGKFEESVQESYSLEEHYPYTRWAHYSAIMRASAYKSMNDTESHNNTLEYVITTYPDTDYGNIAVLMRYGDVR